MLSFWFKYEQFGDYSGEWVGVELHDHFGEHDGATGGVRYFTCPFKRGTFVKKSKLRPEIKDKPNPFETMEIDRNIKVKIEGILCDDCGFAKRYQKSYERCKIYHDYDGKEDTKCVGCDKLLCNRCLRKDDYENCGKCQNEFCWECEKNPAGYCTDCKGKYCGECMKAYELFIICEKCNDKVCNDCAPCACQYGNVDKLDVNNAAMSFNGGDDTSYESGSDSGNDDGNTRNDDCIDSNSDDEMVVVD